MDPDMYLQDSDLSTTLTLSLLLSLLRQFHEFRKENIVQALEISKGPT